jgi:prolyl-tRNA synthetase
VAPFRVGVVNLKPGDKACDEIAANLYARLARAGAEPLLDDTEERAGAKFATMDLIGLPWQAIVGPRGAAAGRIELKNRRTGQREELSLDAAAQKLAG